MKVKEGFRSGFGSILHNKLRSLLTMLGIIIGVASVILLTSIGEGVKQQVASQVESLGANLLYVLPGKIDFKPSRDGNESKLGITRQGFGERKSTLTYKDVQDLKGRENIAAVTGIYSGVDKLDKLNLMVSTTGVDEELPAINKLDFQYGRFFNRTERENRERVAVIGHQANKELFSSEDSTGKSFMLNGREYRVVGVLKYKKPENMGPGTEDINVKIYLPITEVLERVKDKNIGQLLVKATSAQAVDPAETVIRNIVGRNHSEDEYSVIKQQDMVDAITSIMGMLNTALGGIAAISLVVGGIGIMNIMLVSVTERTREIGIRKAVGAKRSDILIQFLLEAVTLSITGGFLGLLIGVAGSRLIPSLVPEIPTVISLTSAIVSLVFTFVVGLFFGVYPATRASKLDPIEALRSE